MKIDSLTLNNVKSFRDEEEISFSGEHNIFIGPNGGGKSNLLDTLTVVLNHYFLRSYTENDRNQGTRIQSQQSFTNISDEIEKHIGEENRDSEIHITLKVTQDDVDNISNIFDNSDEIIRKTDRYANVDHEAETIVNQINGWSINNISPGDEFEYQISNYNLPNFSGPKNTYIQYLKILDYIILLSEDITGINLQPVYFYFSPYWGSSNQNRTVNLQSDNYYQQLHNYLDSTSREQTSAIELALFKLSDMMRVYEFENSTEEFWKEDEVELITNYVNKLGYDWDLHCRNIRTNQYEARIKKGGHEYEMDQLSSGETEIFNFLFGILSVNVQNGIIVIDEPELHLHPRWQSVLLELLEELQELTGNQFIFTTHSPSFITENSIPDVVRIHKDESGSSRAIGIDASNLTGLSDLVHIINSQNNEKMFFADAVVLVEGISDRIIFQSLVDYYSQELTSPRIVEVLEVNGKGNLEKYRNFLQSIRIPNYIIADRDYANGTGTSEVQDLFETDNEKIDDEVLEDDSTQDADTLAEKMDTAIESGDIEEISGVREIWAHIRGRKTRFKDSLSDEEKQIWYEFLHSKQEDDVYILPFGDLEDHLPFKGKSVEKVIDLTKTDNLQEWVEHTETKESFALQCIVGNIMLIG